MKLAASGRWNGPNERTNIILVIKKTTTDADQLSPYPSYSNSPWLLGPELMKAEASAASTHFLSPISPKSPNPQKFIDDGGTKRR